MSQISPNRLLCSACTGVMPHQFEDGQEQADQGLICACLIADRTAAQVDPGW